MKKRTEPFTGEDCCRTMYAKIPDGSYDNVGKVGIIKLETLDPKYQKPDYQLFRLRSGFGCCPTAGGNACMGTFCIDGERTRWERFNFIGIANEEVTKYAEELERKWQKEKQNEAEM